MKNSYNKQSSSGIREYMRRIFFPLPKDQKKQGFEPNFYIRFLRNISKLLIKIMFLNGKNRFSNEFIQMLDPKYKVKLEGGKTAVFRTGHGRLIWRAKTFLDEEPMLVKWIDSFNEDDCFYDIGANIGGYTVYAGLKGIRTLAFEPELLNISTLYENIFLNNLQSICFPIPVALGKKTEKDIFYLKSISKGDALHSIGRKSYLLDNPESVNHTLDTMVFSLDDLIEWMNLEKPTRIKIDVDYNELKVIEGAVNTLEYVKEIYVELDTNLAEHREVIEVMKKNGFIIKEIEDISKQWNKNICNYLFTKRLNGERSNEK